MCWADILCVQIRAHVCEYYIFKNGKGRLYKSGGLSEIIWEALGSLLYSVIEPLISFYEFVSSGYRGQKGVEFYYY